MILDWCVSGILDTGHRAVFQHSTKRSNPALTRSFREPLRRTFQTNCNSLTFSGIPVTTRLRSSTSLTPGCGPVARATAGIRRYAAGLGLGRRVHRDAGLDGVWTAAPRLRSAPIPAGTAQPNPKVASPNGEWRQGGAAHDPKGIAGVGVEDEVGHLHHAWMSMLSVVTRSSMFTQPPVRNDDGPCFRAGFLFIQYPQWSFCW